MNASEKDNKNENALGSLIKAWNALHEKKTAPKKPVDPYPGLRSFTSKESQLFFARKTQTRELGKRFATNNVVLVLGGSGSGKSSLVKAGLLPDLRSLAPVPHRLGKWYVAECRPRTDPPRELVEALWRQICEPMLADDPFGCEAMAHGFDLPPEERSSPAAIKENCRKKFDALVGLKLTKDGETLDLDPYGVYEFANSVLDRIDHKFLEGQQVGPANLFLLIDQFEEIFDDKEIDPRSRSSVAALINLARTLRGGLFVVLTMRSESLHRCAEDQRLVDVVNQSSFLLELVDQNDVREAIIEPARTILVDEWGVPGLDAGTAPFEPELVDELKKEMEGLRDALKHKPDSLPLLQHTLEALWIHAIERWDREIKKRDGAEPKITLADYRVVTERAGAARGATEAGPPSPFRVCLEKRADACLEKTLQLLPKTMSSVEADKIIGSIFATLARWDGGNWVREFATTSRLREVSGIAQVRSLDNADIERALQPFVDAGYLQSDKKLEGELKGQTEYNLSHEALVRSWNKAKHWLEEKRFLIEALSTVDKTLGSENRRTPTLLRPWPSLAPIFKSIGLGIGATQYLANRSINEEQQKALDQVLGARPQFSETWAIDTIEKMRLERSGAQGADDDDPGAVIQEARDRLKQIRSNYRYAKAWSPWGQLLSLGWFVFGLGVVGYFYTQTKAEDVAWTKLLAMLECSSRVEDATDLVTLKEGIDCTIKQSPPARPEAQVAFAQYYARQDKLIRQKLTQLKLAKYSDQPTDKGGHCLTLPDDKHSSIEIQIDEQHIRGVKYNTYKYNNLGGEDNGYVLFIKNGNQEEELVPVQSMSKGIMCLSDGADALLEWEAGSAPVVFPINWLSFHESWLIKYSKPWALGEDYRALDTALTEKFPSEKNRSEKDPDYLTKIHLKWFTNEKIHGFKLVELGMSLENVSGANEPEKVSQEDANEVKKSIRKCETPKLGPMDISDPQRTHCEIKLKDDLNGESYILRRKIDLTNPIAAGKPGEDEETCQGLGIPCQQTLVIFNEIFVNSDKYAARFAKGDHFSALIDGAAIKDGYLYLHDENDAMWRYIFSFPQFKEAIEKIAPPDPEPPLAKKEH